jgi:hypothetical protein
VDIDQIDMPQVTMASEIKQEIQKEWKSRTRVTDFH